MDVSRLPYPGAALFTRRIVIEVLSVPALPWAEPIVETPDDGNDGGDLETAVAPSALHPFRPDRQVL